MKQPVTEVVTVGPELAEQWLRVNTRNRNIRRHVVDRYALDMAEGRWQWNGDTVRFADDGTLLDGQHRLHAIVRAGVAIPLLIVRGLPSEAQITMDGQAKRNLADALALRGEPNSVVLAAGLRRITAHELWGSSTTQAWHGTPSFSRCLETLEQAPEIREAIPPMQALKLKKVGLPSGIGMWLWWLTQQIDPVDSDWFFDHLASGADLQTENPILALRDGLSRYPSTSAWQQRRMIGALAVKAWNKWRAGEEVRLLRWNPGGANPEDFPEPK